MLADILTENILLQEGEKNERIYGYQCKINEAVYFNRKYK